MVPRGRARSEFSRVIRICRYFSLSTLTCVECEQSTLMPLLPLKHLCTYTTCVCAGCSVAVCPFCLYCHFVLFSLLLDGKHLFRWACSPSVNPNQLYWHVLLSCKYKTYWFPNPWAGLEKNSFNNASHRGSFVAVAGYWVKLDNDHVALRNCARIIH